jgi:hypothetical protein
VEEEEACASNLPFCQVCDGQEGLAKLGGENHLFAHNFVWQASFGDSFQLGSVIAGNIVCAIEVRNQATIEE